MAEGKNPLDDPASLRRIAEEKAAALDESAMDGAAALSLEDTRRTLHELRVHQIELEMQNEELRRAQAELDAARTRYFDLYDLAPVGYCTVGANGLILEANLTVATMLGVTRGALVRQPISRFIVKEDGDSYYLHRKRLVETGEPQTCHVRIVKQDESVFWAALAINSAEAEDGESVCRIAINDITEQKQIDEVQAFLARTSSGERDEPFFNALARYLARSLGMDYICIDRLEGDGLTARTLAVWHDGQFEDNVTYGLRDTPCGEVVDKSICWFPSGVARLFPRDQVLQDLGAESYAGVTLLDHANRPIGLIAAIGRKPLENRRLTESVLKMVAVRAAGELERLNSEEALRRSERHFRLLAETITEVFWIADISAGSVIYVSPSYERLWGRTAASVYESRQTFLDAVHVEDRERVSDDLAVQSDNQPVDHEYRIVRPDGEIRWIWDRGFPVREEKGLRNLYVGIAQDITARKQAEYEVQQARKLEAIGLLAGGIAHDFNNILTSVLGTVDAARMDLSPDSDAFMLLGETKKACTRAAGLTRQLLTFSRGGAPVLKTATVQSLIRDSVDFALRGSNVKPDYILPDDLWSVEIDSGQIHQVIQNLVINADQAMPAGGWIRVQAANTALDSHGVEGTSLAEGRYVRILIKDHGTGISEENLAKIFDPYFTTKQAGRGLGLATCYSIVRKHKGHIRCESSPGQGTTFELFLPASSSVAAETSPEPSAPLTGRGRILLMDDDTQLLKAGSALCRRLGYETDTAADGAQAVEMYTSALSSRKPYSAVVMDLTVPGGMGGKEALEKLVAVDPRVKAIVASGYSNDPVLSEFARYGFRGMLAKPFTVEELSQVLSDVVNGEG